MDLRAKSQIREGWGPPVRVLNPLAVYIRDLGTAPVIQLQPIRQFGTMSLTRVQGPRILRRIVWQVSAATRRSSARSVSGDLSLT